MRHSTFALLSGVCLATTAHAATPGWSISEASSGVMVIHAGVSRIAARGGRVGPGDIVTTGQNARAVLVNGDQYAVVSPNSRLEIADPRPSGGLMQFIEKVGNAVFSVKKGSTPHFGVQTPYLAAVVKGTTFSVTVDDAGASVQVIEGAVEVATVDGGAHRLLEPGAIATVGVADLGRLTIQGKTTQVLRSPNAPAPAPAAGDVAPAVHVAAPDAPAPAVIAEAAREGGATSGSAGQLAAAEPVTIAAAIEEAPKSIGQISGGLVSGSTAMTVAIASAAAAPADAARPAVPGNGDGAPGKGGAPGGNGGGKGSGAGNGNPGGNGNGNANGGDAGHGNGDDHGNGNGGNSGNGNGGSSGGGHGNGSGNGSGNGNGNGNGNGGNGNGNGNGNPGNGGGNGNAGNGNGNGNGGGNGNDNAGNGGGNGNGGGHG
jgi:hypothetical protein